MFAFFRKARKNAKKEVVAVATREPEFLNEYLVTVGRSATVVYARSYEEAKRQILGDIRNETPYYDSERLRTCGMKEARTTLRGEVHIIYNGVSTRRNPAYIG